MWHGRFRRGGVALGEERAGDAQHLVAARRRRDDLLDALVEQHGTDPVAPAGQHVRQGRRDLGEHEVLLPVDGPEGHRRRVVEHEPRGELAVLDVLAHPRLVEPRRHVPLDVPRVVARHVLPQVGEVEAGPAEQAAVAALQQPVEPPDDAPLELPQQPLGAQPRAGAARSSGGAAEGVCRQAG